ncbi:MAG: excisionase family DNA-binding protein [Candidatus Komeilibacteria bacterium]
MNKYLSTTEVAKQLGISRIAVFQRIKNGQLKADKIGRNYAIPREAIATTRPITRNRSAENEIDAAVYKTVKEYGETLKLLGQE